MTASSFSTAVGAWPKRDEDAFQRGKQVILQLVRAEAPYNPCPVGWGGR